MNVPQWEYRAAEERQRSEELGEYATYALQAWERQGEGWALAEIVHDFSPDGEDAARAARLFTEHQLDPIHLRDAAEDYLDS